MNTKIQDMLLWQTNIHHKPSKVAVVDDDLVVVVSVSQANQNRYGFIDALDIDTGEPRWSFHGAVNMGLTGGVMSPPAVADGVMLFATGRGRAFCLDAQSGKELWSTELGENMSAAPVIAADIGIFASIDGSVTALALDTGAQRWMFKAQKTIYAAPVIHRNQILAASWDGHLYGLGFNGSLLWDIDYTPARPTSLNLMGSRLILFDAYDNHVRTIQLTESAGAWRGTEVWHYATQAQLQGLAVASDALYFAVADENSVTCLEMPTGDIGWKAHIGGTRLALTLNGDSVIVANREGQIIVFDRHSGVERARLETGIHFISELTVRNEVVYIGGADNTLYAIKFGV